MDECDGLENRYTRKGIVGSNPTPSAKMQPTRPGPTVNPHPSLPFGATDRPIPLSFSPQAELAPRHSLGPESTAVADPVTFLRRSA